MTQKFKIIIGIVALLIISLVITLVFNILTPQEQIFSQSFSDKNSIFAKSGIPSDYLEKMKRQSENEEFNKISDSFFTSKYYYLSKSDVGYYLFILDFKRNILLQNEVNNFNVYYATNTYDKDFIKNLVLNNQVEEFSKNNSQSFTNIKPKQITKEEADVKAEEQFQKIKKLHTEFNNPQTTKERKIKILDELNAFVVPTSIKQEYKNAFEKIKNDQDAKLTEFKY